MGGGAVPTACCPPSLRPSHCALNFLPMPVPLPMPAPLSPPPCMQPSAYPRATLWSGHTSCSPRWACGACLGVGSGGVDGVDGVGWPGAACPAASACQLAGLMPPRPWLAGWLAHGCRHLVVVDEHNRVRGMVTRKDLLGYRLDEAVQRARTGGAGGGPGRSGAVALNGSVSLEVPLPPQQQQAATPDRY